MGLKIDMVCKPEHEGFARKVADWMYADFYGLRDDIPSDLCVRVWDDESGEDRPCIMVGVKVEPKDGRLSSADVGREILKDALAAAIKEMKPCQA